VQQDPTETRNTLLDRLSEHTALGAFIRARFGGTCFYRLACRYWLGGHFLFVASMRQIKSESNADAMRILLRKHLKTDVLSGIKRPKLEEFLSVVMSREERGMAICSTHEAIMQQPEWVQLHVHDGRSSTLTQRRGVQQDPTETRNTLLDRLSEHTALGAFIRARFGGTCFYRLVRSIARIHA
jgi:hypothetical protein